jgi:hypothetical protein
LAHHKDHACKSEEVAVVPVEASSVRHLYLGDLKMEVVSWGRVLQGGVPTVTVAVWVNGKLVCWKPDGSVETLKKEKRP